MTHRDIVEIRTVGQEPGEATLKLRVSGTEPWTIDVLHGEEVARRYEAIHLLAGLRALRRDYEANGVTLLCKGARQDVLASGMSISMSGGRKAYITKIGVQGGPEDLVDIFKPETIENIAPVAAQIAHEDAWRKHWRALLDEKKSRG